MRSTNVSIPLRYNQNGCDSRPGGYTAVVSIPLRYNQNFQMQRMAIINLLSFNSTKVQLEPARHFPARNLSCFNSTKVQLERAVQMALNVVFSSFNSTKVQLERMRQLGGAVRTLVSIPLRYNQNPNGRTLSTSSILFQFH